MGRIVKQKNLRNPFLRGAVRAGLSLALRKTQSRTNTWLTRRSSIAHAPITSQYDVKTVYRKKRMPRRRRRRYVRFAKSVQHLNMKATALQTQLIRENKILIAPQNTTSYVAQMMYSCNGDGGAQGSASALSRGKTNDLNDMLTDGTLTNNPTALVHYQSCTMDTMLRNNGTTPVVVEAYHIVVRSDAQDTNSQRYVENIYEIGFDTPTAVNEGATGTNRTRMDATDIGSTPFNNSMFARYFTVKKKIRIELGAGEISVLQIRDPKNRKFQRYKIDNMVYIPWVTQGYLFQVIGAPTNTEGSNFTEATSVSITSTRTYNYHVINSNFNRTSVAE